MKIILRPACEADVPALITLAQESWYSAFAESAPAILVQERAARQFEQSWYPKYWPSMIVAEEDGTVLGLVQPENDEVNGLWVAPKAQGRGVGTMLLRHAEQLIAEAGYNRVWLTCSGFNPKAALFYIARGYREIDRERNDRGGGLIEELLIFERWFAPVPEEEAHTESS